MKGNAPDWNGTLEQRFNRKISRDEETGCWIWTGSKTWDGYGRIQRSRENIYAHRVSWELANGPIPQGMMLDHYVCGNVSCVNPDHLRLATPQQNCHNCSLPKHNTSGFKGVYWDKEAGKWKAQITFNKKKINLGRFEAIDEARLAYCEAAKKYHGNFANFGSRNE